MNGIGGMHEHRGSAGGIHRSGNLLCDDGTLSYTGKHDVPLVLIHQLHHLAKVVVQ